MMLSALFRPQDAVNSVWGEWPGDDEVAKTGVRVNRTTAMQLMAVYGCVRLITDGISTLPLDVLRDTGERTVPAAKPLWLEEPTADLDFESWCSQVLTSLLLHGNAYIGVTRSGSRIVELVPLDPLKVAVDREGGRKVYRVEGVAVRGEVVHVKGFMLPGEETGLSPIEYARRTIGLGISALDFGQEFFHGEGNMPGVIEAPYAMEPNTRDELAKQWRRKRRKGGRGMPGVLWAGATYKATGVNHEQAQFLQTRQYSASEIAGQMFLVDPTDLGIPVEGTSLTYANLQERSTRRVQVTFLPWIIRLEKAISALLMRPRFVKFNVDGLLRGSQKTRFESYAIGINNGFMTANEARDLEDWEPLPEGVGGGGVDLAATIAQRIYLAVANRVLTVREARELLIRAGMEIPPDFPTEELP